MYRRLLQTMKIKVTLGHIFNIILMLEATRIRTFMEIWSTCKRVIVL